MRLNKYLDFCRSFVWSFMLLGILFFPTNASAQFDSAVVLGTVTDSTDAVVPNALVKLINPATGSEVTTNADGEGNYQFLNVKIGVYQVKVEVAGFSTAVTDNISVTVNARQRVDVKLQTGAVAETVTVEDSPQLLETSSSERGQVI